MKVVGALCFIFACAPFVLTDTNQQSEDDGSERLMVLLGSPLTADVSLVSLPSSSARVCSKPADYPAQLRGAVGTSIAGQALVCGGRGDEEVDYLNTCNSFDGEQWVTYPAMGVSRGFAAATWTPAGWWVTGGRNLDGDLASSEILAESGWIEGPPLPAAMDGHCAVQLDESRTLLAGGYSNGNIDSAYIYDWSYMEWSQVDSLVEGREFLACAVLDSGKIMAAGGYDGSQTLSSTEEFDPDTGLWEEGLQELPEPSSGAGFVRTDGGLGELILVGGGYKNDKVWVHGQEGWGEGQLDGVDKGLYQGTSIIVAEKYLNCQ